MNLTCGRTGARTTTDEIVTRIPSYPVKEAPEGACREDAGHGFIPMFKYSDDRPGCEGGLSRTFGAFFSIAGGYPVAASPSSAAH
jgi:hypothetical protein